MRRGEWLSSPPTLSTDGEGASSSSTSSTTAPEAETWQEEVRAKVAALGPGGQVIAAALASMTLDGDRVACESMGSPWPMLSGPENAGNLAAARAVLTEAWLQTIAVIMPAGGMGKWSAPTMAVGSAAGGKAMVFLAARRARRGARVVDVAPRHPDDERTTTEVDAKAETFQAEEGMPWG